MIEAKYTKDYFRYLLDRIPETAETFLDVGTGRGVMGALLSIYREPKRIDGIEIFEPSARFAKKFYADIYQEDAVHCLRKMPDKSYDVIICLDTIEHLEYYKALELLKEMERVGKKVFISTFSKFYQQECFDGNPYQQHLSIIKISEFKDMGYNVRGFGKLQSAIGAIGRVFFPQFCDEILCWKIT